jgi:hypothetical protein
MSQCEDCRQESIDPLIGREAWRQARLADATGPTGPSGVVHDMRSATGSFAAVVESNLCTCELPGVIVSATFGFTNASTNFLANVKNFPYRDGVVTLTTSAAPNLSDGVWIKAEVVPAIALPADVPRGSLPFSLNNVVADATPNFSESSEYVYAEHAMWFFEDVLNYISSIMAGFNEPEYYSGPIRITVGYGNTTVHDVYSLSPAIYVPSVRVRESFLQLALLPHDVQSSENPTRISAVAVVAGFSTTRSVFSFPVELPEEFQLGGSAQGISLDYQPARMDPQTVVNQQILRGPTITAVTKPTIAENRTDVIVPAGATGPVGQELPLTAAGVHLDSISFHSRTANQYLSNRIEFSYAFGNARFPDRPDLHDQQACYALNGPTWHERNIVRYGSILGVDGARHKLRIKFDWTQPSSSDYVSFLNTLWAVPPTWSVAANISFLLLGGCELDLIPVIQGRHLMPGFYAASATEMDVIEISEIPGINATLGNVGGFTQVINTPATADVGMEIQPIVHAYASSVVLSIAPPSNSPPAYTSLPLPGEDGMTLDAYTIWSQTLQPGWSPSSVNRFWPQARSIAGGQIRVGLQAWFKITMTSVGLVEPWSGNRVVYRRLPTPEIFLDLSDEQCDALSAGDEISVSSVTPFGTNSRVDPYKLQLSIYEPD